MRRASWYLARFQCYFSHEQRQVCGACHDQVREGFTRGELSFGRAAVIVVLDAHKPGEGWATGAAAHTRPKHCSGAGYHSQTCVIKA